MVYYRLFMVLAERGVLQTEREDLQNRVNILLPMARHALAQTAFVVSGQEWQVNDVVAIENYFIAAAPFVHPRLDEHYWSHILLTSLYVEHLSPYVGVNAIEGRSIGYVHDGGRLVAPHRYGRNDFVLGLAVASLGIRQDFIDKLVVMNRAERKASIDQQRVEDKTPIQRVLEYSDNVAKLTTQGDLFRLSDAFEYNRGHSQRYPNMVWPSEYFAVQNHREHGDTSRYQDFLQAVADKIVEDYRVNLDDVRGHVWSRFHSQENQQWLSRVKQAWQMRNTRVRVPFFGK